MTTLLGVALGIFQALDLRQVIGDTDIPPLPEPVDDVLL